MSEAVGVRSTSGILFLSLVTYSCSVCYLLISWYWNILPLKKFKKKKKKKKRQLRKSFFCSTSMLPNNLCLGLDLSLKESIGPVIYLSMECDSLKNSLLG